MKRIGLLFLGLMLLGVTPCLAADEEVMTVKGKDVEISRTIISTSTETIAQMKEDRKMFVSQHDYAQARINEIDKKIQKAKDLGAIE